MTTAQVVTRFAEIVDARDWDRLCDVLAEDFRARYVHSGESFDRDGFVALNRDYPIVVRFQVEDLVTDGGRAVLRARVSNDSDSWYVASFATVSPEELITELVEVWADVVPSVRGGS